MKSLVIIQHYTRIEAPSEQTGQLSLTEMLKGLPVNFFLSLIKLRDLKMIK